jgi:hypothetical protein
MSIREVINRLRSDAAPERERAAVEADLLAVLSRIAYGIEGCREQLARIAEALERGAGGS